MKKNKLIELLNAVPGNPDIVLWNGYVGDWMDISPKLVEGDLVKQSFTHYVRHCEYEEKRDRNDFDFKYTAEDIAALRPTYRNHYTWEQNDFVTLDDIKEGAYNRKRVVYINAKPRGVNTWDRLGNISY